MRTFIRSVEFYVPKLLVINKEIEKKLGMTSDWIVQRSGIKQRYWVENPEIKASDLALQSTNKALEKARWKKEDIDLIIFSTTTPDLYVPGSGCLLQYKLGLETTPTIDIRQQCSGFIYGLSIADAYIKSNMYKKILFVCSEVFSSEINIRRTEKNTAILLGDGAVSLCLESINEPGGILASELHTQGKYYKNYTKDYKSNPVIMNGKQIFKHATKRIVEVLLNLLKENNLTMDDIDLVIPHQANLRISEYCRKKLNLEKNKMYNNIDRYGNTASASIPIALSEAFIKFPMANRFLFVAYGGGETWGAIIYEHE